MNPKLWLTIMILICRIGILDAIGRCHVHERSISGMYLRGHIFKLYRVGLPEECYFRCEKEVARQSYNVVVGQNICELNNRTKEARPEDFIPDEKRFYMKGPGNRESWQKINGEDPVCFGARDNLYGSFNMTKSGRVKKMKLTHRSGSVRCNNITSASYWGCFWPAYGENLMTIITDASKKPVLPPAENLTPLKSGGFDKKAHFYSLPGYHHNSTVNPLSVSSNQEMQIWYGQDWIDRGEENNSGKTCVDVYTWYE